MEVTLDDMKVMYVSAQDGPEGAKEAFDKLEAQLPSLRGRKFYGTYHAGEYRACVALHPEDNPSALGLDAWVIPGGRYIRRMIKDWSERIPEIGQTFISLAEQYPADPDRPSVEFYRSEKELILFLPVLSSEEGEGTGKVRMHKAAAELERWAQWNLNQSLEITTEKGSSLSLSCVNLCRPY